MSESKSGKFGPLVGSVDEGTSSARFLVFAAETSELLTYHQIEIQHTCPHEGWVEQDPMEILEAVKSCIECTVDNLKKLDIDPADIVAIGVTNQRETVIVWDCNTGKPLYNAIVWLDVRTASTVDQVLADVKDQNQDCLKYLCGLPVSTYFSAVKIRWLLDNVPEVKQAMDEKRCYFGTVDTWLLWNLTGGKDGGLYMTDVTNASRTMLMNIKSLQWDPTLCKFFDIPIEMLPEIRSSSEIYGYISEGSLQGVPISGCLGDQQSALVGQMCFKKGQAKNTYGTGCFLLYNTGVSIVHSSHGLLTTVAYRLGKSATPIYALEGSVAICGAAMEWLQDNLNVIKDVKESDKVAQSEIKEGEVYFIPAFSGLYAPYWRKDSRGVICGITAETTSAMLVRATLQSICFQTRDILDAMNKDCGIPLTKLLVDGGMTANNYLMQLQADLCGTPVVRPLMTETTALGAAMAAGSAEGINVWDLRNMQPVVSDTFLPTITEDERDMRYCRWKMAIERSMGWVIDEGETDENKKDVEQTMFKFLPKGLFLFTSFCLLLFARRFRHC